MSAPERIYVVIPASVIAEHGREVSSAERWRAWRQARDAEPGLERERCVIVPSSQLQEVGGEIWQQGER